MADLLAQMKALADPSRLRIVRCLDVEPLHVSEILEALGMGQSRVSRHLRILSDAGILRSSRNGSRIYYGLDPAFQASPLGTLLVGMDEAVAADLRASLGEDRNRLKTLLETRRHRSLAHFQDYGARQDEDQRSFVDGDYYRSRILEMLPSQPGVVLEPGCGAGVLSSVLATRSERLILVDQSRTMLDLACGRSPGAEGRIGDLQHLPLADEEADTAIVSMVLHHIPEPRRALMEIRRVLRPGGQLILADLDEHEEESMRRRFDDFWLGFSKKRLVEEIQAVGFADLVLHEGSGRGRLGCLFVSARRPLERGARRGVSHRSERGVPRRPAVSGLG